MDFIIKVKDDFSKESIFFFRCLFIRFEFQKKETSEIILVFLENNYLIRSKKRKKKILFMKIKTVHNLKFSHSRKQKL